jgi:hypothetical protein
MSTPFTTSGGIDFSVSTSLAAAKLPTCDKFITTNCQPNCTEALTRGCTEARTSNEPDLYRFDGARTHQ